MAHFAKIENGIVTNVIIADQEFIDAGHVEGLWLETTIDAIGGFVYELDDSTPSKLIPTDKPTVRKNYACIGYSYDAQRDAFIPPKPYNSWVLDESKCVWVAPVPLPQVGVYQWDEETVNWVAIPRKEKNEN